MWSTKKNIWRNKKKRLTVEQAYSQATGKNPLNEALYLKNWKGEDVKIPKGHILSPRDLDFSKKPIIEDGPYTTEQRN